MDKILKALPSDANKEKIQEIYYAEGLKNNQSAMVDFFIKVMNEERDQIKRRILILETIKNQPDSLLKYLLELSVALDSDNQAWSKKVTKKVINMGPSEILFNRTIESDEVHSKLLPAIEKILIKFRAGFKDEMLKKMFFYQLTNLYPSEKLPDEKSFWSPDWTLAQLRNFLYSPNFGKPFIGFWYLELSSSTYEAEVMRLLRDVINEEGITKNGKSFSWLLSRYQPKSLEKQIIEIFRELWESGGTYNQFLVLELLENAEMKELMSKEIPELRKPLFQLKRALFFKMLNRGENLNFSIYQLLKLGDRSEELLWWVSFFEK